MEINTAVPGSFGCKWREMKGNRHYEVKLFKISSKFHDVNIRIHNLYLKIETSKQI